MIVWQDVINIAPVPAVTGAATGMQVALLASVRTQVDDAQWGEFADIGRAYLAAHLAMISAGRGWVTNEAVGPLSRGYAAPPVGLLSLSPYGLEYKRLLKIALGPLAIVP